MCLKYVLLVDVVELLIFNKEIELDFLGLYIEFFKFLLSMDL